MNFEDMSKTERTDYKKAVISDFVEHGMDEREALVNYVFCINPQPLNWLEHRYGISREEAVSLRESGMSEYIKNGGSREYGGSRPSSYRKTGSCRCIRPILPQ
ncbi:MAG: hypothetical protein LBU30_03505 [Candidatus Methanoplasma sp.]|nr:hypothetical protein [Candidatus Methanoplasma sp.]